MALTAGTDSEPPQARRGASEPQGLGCCRITFPETLPATAVRLDPVTGRYCISESVTGQHCIFESVTGRHCVSESVTGAERRLPWTGAAVARQLDYVRHVSSSAEKTAFQIHELTRPDSVTFLSYEDAVRRSDG